MLGDFHDDVLNIECETNSADIWVVDAEGVYIDNIGLHSYLENDVVDAINAKYGTNFNTLTMVKVTSVAIGDDCPDWDAYERIYGLYGDKIAINVGHGGQIVFAVGALYDGIFRVISNNSMSLVVSENGQIVSLQGAPSSAVQYWQGMLSSYGLSASEIIAINSSYEVGQNISDWQSYTQYK